MRVGPCDLPEDVATKACGGVLGRGDAACLKQVEGMAAKLRDALWGHRRPAFFDVVLGDGNRRSVAVFPADDPARAVPALCADLGVGDADCRQLARWYRDRVPDVAREWCGWG